MSDRLGRGPDSALQVMLRPLRLYARFAGRAGRREYWLFTLAAFVLQAALLVTMPPLGSIAGFALLTPPLAVAVRRLHDGNRRGWWLLPLPALALPLLLLFGMTGLMLGDEAGRKIFTAIGILLAIMLGHAVLLIVLLARRGTPGPNRFGS